VNTRTGPLIFVLLLALLGLFLAPLAVMSQEAIPLAPDLAADLARPLVVQVVENHPWVASLLILIGSLRLLFKPIMSLVRSRIAATPTTEDDAQLQRVMSSWWYQALAWTLDFVASIKIAPPIQQPASRSTAPSMEGVVRSLALLCVPVLAASVMAGCARFKTTQVDERKNPNGESTTISTTVSASTLWTSRSQLANFKAAQTEKSQGASVGSLSQESSGTNTVRALEAINDILGKIR
jgi:hypothetical protein